MVGPRRAVAGSGPGASRSAWASGSASRRALLGDPRILMFDEPVNGLDPEGIHWIRHLMRGLAAEGRTVFVSSHLMSEMALTADHLIVIGRGRLIADASVADIIARSARATSRSAPRSARGCDGVLRDRARGRRDADGALEVTAWTRRADRRRWPRDRHRAARADSRSRPRSEEAFMELTGDSVDFRRRGRRAMTGAVMAPPPGASTGGDDRRRQPAALRVDQAPIGPLDLLDGDRPLLTVALGAVICAASRS